MFIHGQVITLIRLTTKFIYSLAAIVTRELTLGEEVTFSCTSSSLTDHQQLVWYDGTLLLNSSQLLHGVVVNGVYSDNVTISIHYFRPYHYGNYTCYDGEHLKTVVILIPSSSSSSTVTGE